MNRIELEAQVRRRWPIVLGVALVILVALFFLSPGIAGLWAALLILGAGLAFWPKTKGSDEG
jgi:hypothetical protein